MKIIYNDDNRPVTLYTVTDLAKATNNHVQGLWIRIHKRRSLPMPEVQWQLRRYYSERTYTQLCERLKAEQGAA